MQLGKPYMGVDGKEYQNVVRWDCWETTPPDCQSLCVPDSGDPYWVVERISGPVLKKHYRVLVPPEPTWGDVWAVCDKCGAVEGYHGSHRWIKFKTPADALQAVKAVLKMTQG